ncbi:MAG: hypothetical protein ABIT05_12350 [Chitinophagaceae bacterium]
MENKEVLEKIAEELGLSVPHDNYAINRQLLAEKINALIQNDFQRLVSVLYRVDVSEAKLKGLLQDNPGTDAGLIITDLVIERQLQKIKSRQQFRQRDDNIDENEKW